MASLPIIMTSQSLLRRVIAITVSLVAVRMVSIPMVLGQMGHRTSGGLGTHLPPRLANGTTAPPARITAVVVLGEVRDVGVSVVAHTAERGHTEHGHTEHGHTEHGQSGQCMHTIREALFNACMQWLWRCCHWSERYVMSE